MPRYVPSTLNNTGVRTQADGPAQQNVPQEIAPSMAVIAACDVVRDEHGRRGIGAFLAAASPFLPRTLIEEAAMHFRIEPPASPEPPEPPQKPAKREGPDIPPELLMQLLGGNGGGGLDPMTLLKLMQNK